MTMSAASTSLLSRSPIVMRTAHSSERRTLARLAALDSKAAPRGDVLVAEVDGAIPAALELGSGTVYANPFRPTAHLVALLELRARAA
jgi:hypothetical protein